MGCWLHTARDLRVFRGRRRVFHRTPKETNPYIWGLEEDIQSEVYRDLRPHLIETSIPAFVSSIRPVFKAEDTIATIASER